MSKNTVLLKVLNISRHEVGRILEAWFIRLCYHVAFVVGWTMLTAMVVNEFGIGHLPYLYVANGLLMICGSFVYAKVMMIMKRKTLIILSVLMSSIMLFISGLFFSEHTVLFIILALATFSFFTGQLYILLLGFIEELFSPNENERANPIIETSEPIGGIMGGVLLVVLARVIPVYSFAYFWAGFLVVIIPIMIFFYRKRHGVIKLVAKSEEEDGFLDANTLGRGFHHMKTIPFVKGLALVVLCHWIFVSMLNFQYTKALDASLGHGNSHEVAVEHDVPGAHGEEYSKEEEHVSIVDDHKAPELHDAAPLDGYTTEPVNTESHVEALTHGLGTLHIIFSMMMLLVQLLFSSRVVEKFGVVNSMKFLPGVSLASAVGMLFSFTFATAVIAKAAYEMLLVIYNNAYHNSYYAISEKLREQIREFMEGMIRPVGVIIGTVALIVYQVTIPYEILDNVIIISMIVVLGVMIGLLFYIKTRYTLLAKKNTDLSGEKEEKLAAIEILSQQGHTDASDILTKNLIFKKESPRTKQKILASLARLRDVSALPEILECVEDASEEVQVSALRALASFKNLGQKFYTQAFAKFRVVNTLTSLFKKTASRKVKSEIIQVFAKIHHGDVVQFLLEMLQNEEDEIKADIIEIIGMFDDINAAHYIEQYLSAAHPMLKANTIIALWQFKKYRLKLLVSLMSLLDDADDKDHILAGIHVLGEVRAVQELQKLQEYATSEDEDVRMHALVALAKMGELDVIDGLVEILIGDNRERACYLAGYLEDMNEYILKTIEAALENRIYEKIGAKHGKLRNLLLVKLSKVDLEELVHYFSLVKHEKNLMKLAKTMGV